MDFKIGPVTKIRNGAPLLRAGALCAVAVAVAPWHAHPSSPSLILAVAVAVAVADPRA